MVDWAYRLMHRWAFFLLLAVVPSVCLAQTSGLITGIVLRCGGTLITRDVKHFERVEGLRLSGVYD